MWPRGRPPSFQHSGPSTGGWGHTVTVTDPQDPTRYWSVRHLYVHSSALASREAARRQSDMQARARGWLRGGEAEQLDVVAAAVHARRVGQAPCRLFVALLRDQRWEVITQEDEDQARRLLREHRDGPCQRTRAAAAVSE